MAAKKHLGKGLDLLLSASSGKPMTQHRETPDSAYIEKLFSQALAADDEGNSHEAYHLYRLLIDHVRTKPPVDDQAVSLLTSQALNNAAIILHDAGCTLEAREFLQQACDICPDNEVARENLELTS